MNWEYSHFTQLQSLLTIHYQEYQECIQQNLFLSSAVLLGAIFETILLYMCCAFPKESEELRKKRFPKKEILRLTLGELISLSRDAGWFGQINSSVDRSITMIADLRNLIHPGRQIKIGSLPSITLQELESSELLLVMAIKELSRITALAAKAEIRIDRDLFEAGGEKLKAILPKKYWPLGVV